MNMKQNLSCLWHTKEVHICKHISTGPSWRNKSRLSLQITKLHFLYRSINCASKWNKVI